MEIGKGLLLLLLLMSAFSGIGLYLLAVSMGWADVCIPYAATDYMDYTIRPKGKK